MPQHESSPRGPLHAAVLVVPFAIQPRLEEILADLEARGCDDSALLTKIRDASLQLGPAEVPTDPYLMTDIAEILYNSGEQADAALAVSLALGVLQMMSGSQMAILQIYEMYLEETPEGVPIPANLSTQLAHVTSLLSEHPVAMTEEPALSFLRDLGNFIHDTVAPALSKVGAGELGSMQRDADILRRVHPIVDATRNN